MTNSKTFIVGISGCSSTGKTTLAKLAAEFIPSAVLVHEDDFYKHDEDVPMNEKYGIRDWDSADALDMKLFRKELESIKQTGKVATELIHNNNVDDISKFNFSRDFTEDISNKMKHIGDNVKIVIVDGFMLFNRDDIAEEFDLRLFIRAPYKTLKRRRAARNGYQTLDSFWVDPPYYFDEFVYKSYAENHKHLFKDNDVEGDLTQDASERIFSFNNDDDVSINESLTWILEQIAAACEK